MTKNRPSLALYVWGLLFFTCRQGFFAVGNSEGEETEKLSPMVDSGGWSWDRILTNRQTIYANGNVFPPPPDESADDCLVLITHNQIICYCPMEDDARSGKSQAFHNSTVIFRASGGRLRGAFSAPGTDRRRLWLLESPQDRDLLMELDTVSGEILQVLEIEGTLDGHDAVRVDFRIFIVDTKHGRVVEIELPASAPPYEESSINAGAKKVLKPGFVNIVKRHTGFTKADHINNVAIHPQLLISNLHGGHHRDTRLSALSRSMSEENGRELNEDRDGFTPVTNAGTWCHNIAFWEDPATSEIKLISLDSKAGSLVSVSLSGSNRGEREVLWLPDSKHPTLIPPEGVTKAYDNGVMVFTKGLAVQGGVAFFAASYARAPPLRKYVPETLLVAVDLSTKEELWNRTIRSNGLLNQILTESYLGWKLQLPTEISSVELTYHAGGGSLVEHCEDIIPKGSRFCKPFEKDYGRCSRDSTVAARYALEVCCACDGGHLYHLPLMAGELDEEIMKLDEEVTATATFTDTRQCADKNKRVKHLPLAAKSKEKIPTIANFDRDLDYVVKHICNLNVAPIEAHLRMSSKEVFELTTDMSRNQDMDNTDWKMDTIQLIESFRDRDDGDSFKTYHLSPLESWFPLIETFVLRPMGLSLNRIIHMKFTNISSDAVQISHPYHTHAPNDDTFTWKQKSHHVHIPIITHPHVFFLTEIGEANTEMGEREILRIRSNPGEAYEFNNMMPYTEYNYGASRCIHLVLDWVEDKIFELSARDQCNKKLEEESNFLHTGSQICEFVN